MIFMLAVAEIDSMVAGKDLRARYTLRRSWGKQRTCI